MSQSKRGFAIAATLAVGVFGATQALAQCGNITGNPAPTLEPNLTQKVALNNGPGNVWGDGNDRFKLVKGIFTTATPFDPILTDNVTFTFRLNTVAGSQIVTTTVFAADPLWTFTSSPNTWSYVDPAAPYPFGIRQIRIRELSPNTYLIIKVLGRDVALLNAPLGPADDMHVMLEVWDAGNNGICVDSTLTSCNGAGTTCQP